MSLPTDCTPYHKQRVRMTQTDEHTRCNIKPYVNHCKFCVISHYLRSARIIEPMTVAEMEGRTVALLGLAFFVSYSNEFEDTLYCSSSSIAASSLAVLFGLG